MVINLHEGIILTHGFITTTVSNSDPARGGKMLIVTVWGLDEKPHH